ncbi:zinc-dependent alcohol dehydrogenase family protein [Rhizobium sp. G187]|uniref:zinc-dependent alcohol dehydrogenase family protein n=1 Tax=Rhizobium sp. G187 TaxID=3451352 RepID=UPI003EE5C4FB
MARMVRFYEHGGPEVLRLEPMDLRPPGPGEVQIRVKAIGVNRADALLRSGTYIENPPLPSGLGLEAAGIVEALGPGAQGFEPGDVVSVIPPISMARWPAYSELATFPVEHIVKHPPSLDWQVAASIWMQYLTAYGALIDISKLSAGDFAVVTAASSSVGIAAIQIANMVGATAIAITRTSKKRAALIGVGAAHVIASDEEDLRSRLFDIVGLDGARVVFDPIGGPTLEPLTSAMSKGGILIEYGGLSPEPTPFPLFTVLSKTLTLRGYLVHEVVSDPLRLAAAKQFILDGLNEGYLRPVIARTFRFDEIVDDLSP